MIALAHCSTQQRIIVAGAKAIELTFELNRRGFARVASTANCGHASAQYDVALVDWRKRTFKTLEATLDWLVDFLRPEGLLVIWADPQKASGRQDLCAGLERRGFMIEDTAVHSYGTAVSARRRESKPLPKAA
jgi:acetolactate synthase regulatory subunit